MPRHTKDRATAAWILDAETPFANDERETDELPWTLVSRKKNKGKNLEKIKKFFKPNKYRTKVCSKGKDCHFNKIGGCYYWHPSATERTCKTLCKDRYCSDPKCLYKHLSPLKHAKSNTPCKFTKCMRALCPFLHDGEEKKEAVFRLPTATAFTKKCRYGDKCRRRVCFYAHSRKELRASHRHEDFGEVPIIGSPSDQLSGSMSLSNSSASSKNTDEVATDIVNYTFDQVVDTVRKQIGEEPTPFKCASYYKDTSAPDGVNNGVQISPFQYVSTAHNQNVEPDILIDPDVAVYESVGIPVPIHEITRLTKGVIKVGELVTDGEGYVLPIVCSTQQPELKMFEGRILLQYSFLPTQKGSCGTPVYCNGQVVGLHIVSNACGPIKANFAIPIGRIQDQIKQKKVSGNLQVEGQLQGYDDNPRVPAQESNIVTDIANVVSTLARGISGVARGVTGIASFFDTPAQIPPQPQQLYTSDIPRKVYTVGFKRDDYNMDQSEVLSCDDVSSVTLQERIKIPSRIDRFEWKTSDIAGTRIGEYPVCPTLSDFYDSGSHRYWDTSMLGAVALQYRMWRGTINFDITVLPTSFHQGQLYVCFNPAPQNLAALGTGGFSKALNLGGVTLDLSVSNTTKFVVPYVSTTDFKHCNPKLTKVVWDAQRSASYAGGSLEVKDITGMVSIFVQNPLIASSDKVPNTIDVNVSISVGDDFEFKIPRRMCVEYSFLTAGTWNDAKVPHPSTEEEEDENMNNNNAGQGSGAGKSGPSFVDAPVQESSCHTPSTGKNIGILSRIPTATTSNVMAEPYLVRNDIKISLTDLAGDVVFREKLPNCLFKAELAPSGLAAYHAFYRSDFIATLRLNTTQFQSGCARLMFEPIIGIINKSAPTPADNNHWASFSATSQLPHADINFNGQTECTLVIPWASIGRTLTNIGYDQTHPSSFGVLSLYIWNPLRSSVTNTLTGSLWLQAIDPYFAVRRMTGDLQGSDADVPIGTTEQPVVVKANEGKKIEKKYLCNSHMNAVELLRRADLLAVETVEYTNKTDPVAPGNNGGIFWKIMDGPVFGGFSHTFIRNLYAFHSGSTRLNVFSTCCPYQPVIMAFLFDVEAKKTKWTVYDWKDSKAKPPSTLREWATVFFGEPSAMWHLGVEPFTTIEIPQYTATPIVQNYGNSSVWRGTPSMGTNNGTGTFYLQFATFSNVTSTDFHMYLSSTVGEDYLLYYPVPPMILREPKPARLAAVDEFDHCDILLSGDVEQNPGPKDILLMFNEWGFGREFRPEVSFSQVDNKWFCWILVKWREQDRIKERIYHGEAFTKKDAKRLAVSKIPDFRIQEVRQFVGDLLDIPETTAEGPKIREQMGDTEIVDILPDFGFSQKLLSGLSSGAKSLLQYLSSVIKDFVSESIGENKDFFLDLLRDISVLVLFFDNLVLSYLQGKNMFHKIPLYLMALRRNQIIVKLVSLMTSIKEQALDDGLMQSVFRMCIQSVGSVLGCNFSDVTVNRVMYDFARPGIIDMGKKFYEYISGVFKRLVSSEISLSDAVKRLSAARTTYNERRDWFTTDLLFKHRQEFVKIYDEVKLCQPVVEKYGKPGFNFFMKEVNERYTMLAKIALGSGPRCEPVGIMLSGESGKGKTIFQTILARSMAKYLLPKEQRDSESISRNIYALRPGEIEYMDGYCMQDVVTVDDALADADYKTVMPFVQLISTAPTPVAMADLSEKGRFFTSKAVVISSNFSNIQGYNEIKHHEAINRRFELCYHIECLRPNVDSKLDIQSVLEESKSKDLWDVLDSHICFHSYVFGSNSYTRKGIKPSAVFKECMDRLKHKISTFGNFEYLYNKIDQQDFNNSAITRVCSKCDVIHDEVCQFASTSGTSYHDVQLLDQLHMSYRSGELAPLLEETKYTKVQVSLDHGLLVDEEAMYDYLKDSGETNVDRLCTIYSVLQGRGKNLKAYITAASAYIKDTVTSFMVFVRTHFTKILGSILAVLAAVAAYYIATKVKLGERFTNLSLYFEEWYAQKVNRDKLREIIAHAPRHQYGKDMLDGLLNGEIKPYKGKTEIPHWAFLEGDAMDECKECYKECGMDVDEEEVEYWKRVISLLRRSGAIDEQSLREGFRRPPRKISRREQGKVFDASMLVPNVVPLYSNIMDDVVVGYGFLVDNVNLLVPKHYLSVYQHMYMSVNAKEVRQEINLSTGRSVSDKDLLVVNVPPQQSVRNRIKMFLPSRSMLGQYAGYGHRVKGKLSLTTGEDDTDGILKLGEIRQEGFVAGTEFLSLRVTKETKQGMCGTPYMCGSFIMGFHVNGAGFDAGMALVTREDIEPLLYPGYVEYDIPICEQISEPRWTGDEVGFKHLGSFYGPEGDLLAANVNMSTEKVHSDMYNDEDFPDDFEVSPKNYEILFKRSNKYGFHQPLGSHSVLETQFALSLYESVLEGVERDVGLLSDDVILNGNDEIMPLKIDSSAGHWSCISDKKKAFIDVEETPEGNVYSWSDAFYNTKHPVLGQSLSEVIDERVELAKKGVRKESFWVTTLKDELLPKEKVSQGKTRVFEAPPLDTTILFKRYFGNFANWYRHHAGPILSHTIGVEKEKVWASLYHHLKRNSDKGIAADYSQFDGTIPPLAFQFFGKVARLYYAGAPEEEHKVRDVLIHELQHTTQLIGCGLYQSAKGNKSGNYITDVFNSIVNVWAWMTSFHRVYSNEIGRNPKLDDWFENVTLFTHGDDCVSSLKQIIRPQKLLDEIRALGFIITAADKKEGDIQYEDVEKLTYLKSGFRIEQGVVWPPMPVATCYREVNWCKRSMRENSTVRKTQISEGRRFAAYHGIEQLADFDLRYKRNVHKELGLVLDPVIPESFDAIATDVRLKQLMQEMCPDNMFGVTYLDYFISLLICGDIESNPGPLRGGPLMYRLLRDVIFEYRCRLYELSPELRQFFTHDFDVWFKEHLFDDLQYSWTISDAYKDHPSLSNSEIAELILMTGVGIFNYAPIEVHTRKDSRRSRIMEYYPYGLRDQLEIGLKFIEDGERVCDQTPLTEFILRYIHYMYDEERLERALSANHRPRAHKRVVRIGTSYECWLAIKYDEVYDHHYFYDMDMANEELATGDLGLLEDLTIDGDVEPNPGPDGFTLFIIFLYYWAIFNIAGYYYLGPERWHRICLIIGYYIGIIVMVPVVVWRPMVRFIV